MNRISVRKLKKISLVFLMFFVVAQFSSCRKFFDIIFDGKDEHPKCRITSYLERISSEVRTNNVYYNNHGDIDSIISNIVSSISEPNRFYFVYDNNHRLIEHRRGGGDPGEDGAIPYFQRHTYSYENGRIATDTLRTIATVPTTLVSSLEYDYKGRVVKESGVIIESDGTPVNDVLEPVVFEYGSDGNLVREGIAYDNKVNFLATDQHLMFTQRDYSKNNWLGATSYNSPGFPLGFDDRYADFATYSLFYSGLPEEINYACD